MSPLERLLLETVPTRPGAVPHRGPWSEDEQETHWRALCEAVGTPDAARPPVLCTACRLPIDRDWYAAGNRQHATCT